MISQKIVQQELKRKGGVRFASPAGADLDDALMAYFKAIRNVTASRSPYRQKIEQIIKKRVSEGGDPEYWKRFRSLLMEVEKDSRAVEEKFWNRKIGYER